jgi:hypothetical protein
MEINVWWSIFGIKKPLVFFDWAQNKNDVIMHEGQSLAGFPSRENGRIIDLVLSLGEDANDSDAPIRVGSLGVGHNSGFSLGRELSVFIDVNAVCEQLG